MLSFLLTRTSPHQTAPTYYHVAVEYNLFGEYSVMRQWGQLGQSGRQVLVWFSNIRDACDAADHWRAKALARGYLQVTPPR